MDVVNLLYDAQSFTTAAESNNSPIVATVAAAFEWK